VLRKDEMPSGNQLFCFKGGGEESLNRQREAKRSTSEGKLRLISSERNFYELVSSRRTG